MKMIESIKRWINVSKNVMKFNLNKRTDYLIDNNLVDLINDELETNKQNFNDNCYKAAEFNVSVKNFKENLDKLKNSYDSFCNVYKNELIKLKNDSMNETLRSKVSSLLIKKNQIKDEITMKEEAYKNLINEQDKLEKCIKQQKISMSEQKAKVDLLLAKKSILDMYKKMNISTNPLLEKNTSSYLDRLDNEIKVNSELKDLSEKISPEDNLEKEIEMDQLNKIIDEDLKTLD